MRILFSFAAVFLAIILVGCGGSVTNTSTQNGQPVPAAFMFTAGPNAPAAQSFSVSNAGMLTAMATATPLTIGDPVTVNTDTTGRFLYVWQQALENDDTGDVGTTDGLSVYRINASAGTLQEVPGSPLLTPDTRLPSNMFFSTSGLAFTREGSNIGVYRQDNTTGLLHELPGSPYALAGQLAAVSPSGNMIVVLSPADSSARTYSIDATTSAPTLLSSATLSGPVGGQAVVSPDGRSLIANFGTATDLANGLDIFRVATDGSLTRASSVPLPSTSQMTISSDGRFLYVVTSSQVMSFALDTTNGRATQISSAAYSPLGPVLTAPVISGSNLFVSEFFHVSRFPIDPVNGSVGAGSLAADITSGAQWLNVVPATGP